MPQIILYFADAALLSVVWNDRPGEVNRFAAISFDRLRGKPRLTNYDFDNIRVGDLFFGFEIGCQE